ncbi:hypothetical protein JZO70_12550 [Enterococcus sp. 669A]|uniref:Lipoprotein n=1 Tax=Candidatus Enterococcus moelleringii TaxID=2815325 RepID=A0ABS3LBI9_9ENTE|nr:hypothetical protein [Enterococcus sp. 669A]MBO1306998.1 hypothetical protein [Enterococcus sp. 669A]
MGKKIIALLMLLSIGLISCGKVEKTSKTTIGFEHKVEEDEINAIVGERGTLTPPQPFEGIEAKWVFREITDNEYVRLDKEGNWETLKAGTTEILPLFDLSQQTSEELADKYDDLELVTSSQAWYVSFNIYPDKESLENPPVMDSSDREVKLLQ